MIHYRNVSVPSTAREARLAFPRVVAGVDFSAASLSAARWATSHVARDAEAIITHVIPPLHGSWETDDSGLAELGTLRQMGSAVYGGLGGFAATLSVAGARTVVRVGRASHWLSALIADANASLLILGRRTDSNRRRIGEPNVLERSARRAPASVLVVPEGTTEAPRHIVAAIDRSDAAAQVLAVARSLAAQHECPLILQHVLAPTTGVYDRVIRSDRGEAKRRATSGDTPSVGEQKEGWIADLVRAEGLENDHRLVITAGDPVREIAAIHRFDAPLIVVGKRGQDGAPLGSLGSVARELLTRAPFPVLAVGDDANLAGPRDGRAKSMLSLS